MTTVKKFNTGNIQTGIYVHIPFCVRKCIYCDFTSYSDCSNDIVQKYFEALYKEARMVKDCISEFSSTAPDSIFIGGGTPSSVDSAYIEKLMNIFSFKKESEKTIEANPGTVTAEKLQNYRKCGINRISIGIQSLQDSELKFLGRIHSADDAYETVRMARNAGFENINIDLIFGFPGQSMESWKDTLNQAMILNPEHISFYSLQIEEGTLLYEKFRSDEVEQISDELNREMYHYAIAFLKKNGYQHYEISNAAKQGYQCKHNLKYWNMVPYIGIGASAHSYLEQTRFYNPSGIEDYCSLVDNNKEINLHKFISLREPEKENLEERMSDFMFTGMRQIAGINVSDFNALFRTDFEDKYRDAIAKNQSLGFVYYSQGILKFTDAGLDIANTVLLDFI